MNIRPIFALLPAFALFAGCATFSPSVDQSRVARAPLELPGKGTDCVFGEVRDFRVLDENALLLYTSARNRAYYVEITGVCPGLDTAFQLGFEDRDGRICGFGMDKIVIPGGAFTDRCPISRIHKLEDGEIARVLEYYGKVRVEKAAPPPQDGEAPAQPDNDTKP